MKLIALLIILVSGVLYQICSKSIPSDVNPFIPLLCTYAIAFLCALLLAAASGGLLHIGTELKKVNRFSFLLGAVICFYELGFLLAYRHGFSLTTLPPLANILVIVAVCGIGLLFYGESMPPLHLAGLGLAVVGVILTIVSSLIKR